MRRPGIAVLLSIGLMPVLPGPAQAAAPADPCAGLQRITTARGEICAPAPDHFPGTNQKAPVRPMPNTVARARALANPIVCDGDGTSGKRVEVLYVREQSKASRFGQFSPSLRAWAHEIDAAFNDSAAATGASRHVRYVTEPAGAGCQVKLAEVVLADGALGTLDTMIPALQNLGYSRADRKYMVYAESTAYCGIAPGYYGDDRPGPDNLNNTRTGYARVDAGCWGFNGMGHELGHLLGAVQASAPNADGSAHCLDEYDLMCYGAGTTVKCPDKDSDRLLDCNHNDYFHTSPPAGSYLATHWNVANSDWLIKSATPDPRDGPRDGQAYVLLNAATGNAIDVVGSSPDNLAYLSHRAPSGATSQRWRFSYYTDWNLQNVNSGKCADSAYSGTDPGTQILQYNCNSQLGMHWTLYPLDDGRYGILNSLTGYAVTDSGVYPEPLRQQPFTAGGTQQWTLQRAPLPDGRYRIRAEVSGPNRVLDVTDCSTAEGADVRIWVWISTSPCQRWQVSSLDGGTVFRISDPNSGKSLSVAGCSTADTTPVELRSTQDADCQKWRIDPLPGGSYKVIGVASGKSLDVAACSPAAGANVIIWPFHGGTCQRWFFDPVS